MRLLDEIGESVVQVGIDRLRRHEHDRRRLHFAGYEVFFRDVAYMPGDVGADARERELFLFVRERVPEQGETFKRKFGINHYAGLRAGEDNLAIRAVGVGEPSLKLIEI